MQGGGAWGNDKPWCSDLTLVFFFLVSSPVLVCVCILVYVCILVCTVSTYATPLRVCCIFVSGGLFGRISKGIYWSSITSTHRYHTGKCYWMRARADWWDAGQSGKMLMDVCEWFFSGRSLGDV